MSVLESGYAATMNDLRFSGERTAQELERFKMFRLYLSKTGHEARAFKFSEMEKVFSPLGARVVWQAGVRFEESDRLDMLLEDFDQSEYQNILSEERILGHDPSTMERAQLLQLILCKSESAKTKSHLRLVKN